MEPRSRRVLLVAIALLLALGLLLSGGVHIALHADPLHADDAGGCEACWLACPEPPAGDEALAVVLVVRDSCVVVTTSRVEDRAPLCVATRGPPRA